MGGGGDKVWLHTFLYIAFAGGKWTVNSPVKRPQYPLQHVISKSFKSNLSFPITIQESANCDNTLTTAVMAGSLACADDRMMEAMLKHFQIFTLLKIRIYYHTAMPFHFHKQNV
jgi:hypothetical protein